MKINTQKLNRAAELIGTRCDLFGWMNEFDRFEAKRKQEQSEEANGHLLAVSSWEDTPKAECIRELVAKQQDLYKLVREKELLICNIAWETASLQKTTVNEKQMDAITSEESLQILRRMLAEEEHQLAEEEQKLKFNKNEAARLSNKYKLYKCILPLECNTLSTDPLSIEAILKRNKGAPTDSYIFSESDLHSSELTNQLWNY